MRKPTTIEEARKQAEEFRDRVRVHRNRWVARKVTGVMSEWPEGNEEAARLLVRTECRQDWDDDDLETLNRERRKARDTGDNSFFRQLATATLKAQEKKRGIVAFGWNHRILDYWDKKHPKASAPLGLLPDDEAAKVLGVSEAAYIQARKRIFKLKRILNLRRRHPRQDS